MKCWFSIQIRFKIGLFFSFLGCFTFSGLLNVMAQSLEHKPRKSPVGLATFKKDDLYLKVTYGRPSIPDEETPVFGKQVPWRRLWRTGDDDATELTTTDTLDVLGTTLLPGTYTLFTIPDTAEWTVILNREVGQWGHYTYNPEANVLSERVPLYQAPRAFLQLSIFLEEAEYGADLVLIWRFSAIRIPLKRKENFD